MELLTTSYIITWVGYLIFGVESSSPLAASYLVHSACFQHEADQSRSSIASEVTKLWNSTDHTHLSAFGTNMRHEFIGHLNTKGQVACPSHHAGRVFGTIWKPSAAHCKQKKIFPSLLPKTQESIILQEPILHSKCISSESGCRVRVPVLEWFRLYPPTAQHIIYLSLHNSLRRWTYTLSLN